MEDRGTLLSRARSGDDLARQALVAAYRQQVEQITRQICRRPLQWENDDELSIALIAFNTAIDSYNPAAGSFDAHCRTVIRHRLIDHFRREGRHRRHLSLEAGRQGAAREAAPAFEGAAATAAFQESELKFERAEEIRRYAALLAQYQLNLVDLKSSAPSHQDTRRRLTEIAGHLARSPDLAAHLRRTRQIPLRELAQRTGASRKVLETGRRYIVAVALLMMHREFEHLRSFAGLEGGEGGGGS